MMPKPKGSRPVAFFDLSEELSRGDIDAAVERVMRVIGERSREVHQIGEFKPDEGEADPEDDVTE